jgi:hypothetical protein
MPIQKAAIEHELPDERTPGARFIGCLYVLVVVMGSLGAWLVYRVVSTAAHAEANLHYSLEALEIVERFVTQNGRWPRSWAELEGVDMRDGGIDRDWLRVSAGMQQWIIIDFGADPQDVAQQERMKFSAIRPKGPYYEYRDYGYVDRLQDAIRKSISGGKQKSSRSPSK